MLRTVGLRNQWILPDRAKTLRYTPRSFLNTVQTFPSVDTSARISAHRGIRCESAEPEFSQVQADFRLSRTFTSARLFKENDSSYTRTLVVSDYGLRFPLIFVYRNRIQMSAEQKLSKVELLKAASHQLRGTLGEEIQNDKPEFSDDAATLLKHHGSYLQDDRDTRKAKGTDGKLLGKHYSCMVRTRIPGGRVTAAQFLAELDLCEKLANGTLRITSRQGFQLHGVLKGDLREAIRAINESKLTTLAACGDVNRNVMACPAPYKTKVYEQMQALSQELAEHFKPRTRAYYDLWLKDENGEEVDTTEFKPVEEPIYGVRY